MGAGNVRGQVSLFSSRWVAVCRLPSYQREIHALFDDLIHRTWGRTEWQPDVDVLETARTFIIEFDLPGVEEGAIRVSVHDRSLIIEGERKIQYPDDLLRAYVSERPIGRFVRTFEFKFPLDPARIRKYYANGILTLIITKEDGKEES